MALTKPTREACLTSRVVGLLILWFVLDVGGRFLPVAWLHILPEHVATRRPGRYAPFIPNLDLEYAPWVGETALTGNLEPTERRSPIRFRTDAWGFRFTPDVEPGSQFDYLLHEGASFAYGGGLSDEETLPAVLTHESGLRMYNGGHFFRDKPGPEPIHDLLQKAGHQRPMVVLLEWEQAERDRSQLEGLPWRTDAIGRQLLGSDRYARLREDLQYGKRFLSAVWSISPLEILSIRFFKGLSNDSILPNPYRAQVVERKDAAGRRILFLRDEVERTLKPPDARYVERRADYFALYRRLLNERHLQMFVVLLPNKYTLYGPGLDHIAPSPYLNQLEAALQAQGIPTLNMLTEFSRTAGREIESGQYSYYREDHHWSPLGVRLTAAKLADRLRALRAQALETPHALQ